MTWSTWRWPLRATGVLLLVSLWLLASIPWGLSAVSFLIFTAPGAVLGIATAWMSHIFERGDWNWRSGTAGALVGASVLPPFLAFMLTLTGSSASPRDILTLFVLTPWFALAAGVAIGFMRKLWRNKESAPR
jgi:hypothetical protein